MISLTPGNVITIGLIALAWVALAKWGLAKAGVGTSWL